MDLPPGRSIRERFIRSPFQGRYESPQDEPLALLHIGAAPSWFLAFGGLFASAPSSQHVPSNSACQSAHVKSYAAGSPAFASTAV
jgi:hypothetical protein